MAFSELINRLIPDGAVLAGNKPKTILADDSGGGSEPGYYDTSTFGNLLRKMEESQVKKQAKEAAAMKKNKDRSDMYKTLRDSGYDPQKAYEAVMKNQLPQEAGGITSDEKKSQAEVLKIEAQTAREKATTKKIERQTSILTQAPGVLRQKIIAKVANGEDLTTGEQKIYDEVIRKYGQKSDLDSIL